MDPTKPPPVSAQTTLTMIAKYGKTKIELPGLSATTMNVGQVKELLREKTGILPKRQKLIGLRGAHGAAVGDDTPLSDLKVKGSAGGAGAVHQFILMGTPEEDIFVDPSEKAGLPDVIDDFELDFHAGSDEVRASSLLRSAFPDPTRLTYLLPRRRRREQWVQHKAKEDNLQRFTASTEVHIIPPPRSRDNVHKPLLVLDLDHTLLDFSSKTLRDNAGSAAEIGHSDDAVANQLKR